MIQLPERIFLIGAPGCQFSGISQLIEENPAINTSDHEPHRQYIHHNSIHDHTNHGGVYFGTGMEFELNLNPKYIDSAWATPGGTRIVKSHEWSLSLGEIRRKFPNDWIMLVYRPDMSCYAWWHEAGGFSITYPKYTEYYRNHTGMLGAIANQNNQILKFSTKNDLTWNAMSGKWIEKTFGHKVTTSKIWHDVLVTVMKGQSDDPVA